MTLADLCIELDDPQTFIFGHYGEAIDCLYRVRELAYPLAPAKIERIGQLVVRLHDNMVAATATAKSGGGNIVGILDGGLHIDTHLMSKRDAYEMAIETVVRIRDLAKLLTADQLEHLAYRLGSVGNDIVFAAGQPFHKRLSRRAVPALWRRSH